MATLQERLQQKSAGQTLGDRTSSINIGGVPLSIGQKQAQIADNLNPVQNFGIGAVKGALSTVKGLGTIGEKIGTSLGLPVLKGQEGFVKGTPEEQALTEKLTPSGTAQNVGKGVEQFAEFFIPASKAMKAENLISTLSKGIASKPASALTRILGKSVVQGLTTAGVVGAQTGGDVEEMKKTGLIAGLTRGGFATIGEGARAIKLPERFYSTIFKNSYNDMKSQLNSEVISELQKTNPEKYQKLVDAGLVKMQEGVPVIDDTIAKQALDRGLRGSIRNMAKQVISGTQDNEIAAQEIAKTYAGKIDMSEPQFANILKQISEEYDNVGFGEISDEASALARKISGGNGQVDLQTALSIRRLLDKARIARSYDVPANKLSMSQANLKTLADKARERVNAVPEMGSVMKEYAFNIEALETLAKEAARRGNNQALSLIDSLFLSSSFGGERPEVGLAAALARKFFISGQGMTGAGQFLQKETGNVLPGAIGGVTDAISSQTTQ
jgi:hypothetical protein